ncbi:hypothetical protein ACFL3M_01010, partial [Patescibacteria group bacterium]
AVFYVDDDWYSVSLALSSVWVVLVAEFVYRVRREKIISKDEQGLNFLSGVLVAISALISPFIVGIFTIIFWRESKKRIWQSMVVLLSIAALRFIVLMILTYSDR